MHNKYKITDNDKFFADYKRMTQWVYRNGEASYPRDKYIHLGVGQKAMLRLAQEYLEFLEKRDKLMEFYRTQYPSYNK